VRIIVPIKQVPETNAVKMDPETGTMVRDGVEAIVNPLDLYAIEVAIQLRDAHGGEVASFLDLPVASYIGKVERVDEKSCTLHRLVENGHEIIEVDLPAVLTVVKEVASPRLPTLRGKQRARGLDIPVWKAGDIQADADKLGLAGSPTRVVKIFRPQVTRQCEKVIATDEASTGQAIDKLVAFLQAKELI